MEQVVVGGGIAGVCCAEELCRLAPQDEVVLVSASTVLKGVGNVVRYSKNLEEFEVVERDLTSLPYPNLTLIQATATSLDHRTKRLYLSNKQSITYDRLVVCTGAAPKRLACHERVLVLRDTDSVQRLCATLPGVRRLMLAGNGGIALELINALRDVEVVWVMKHAHIGDAFLDADAAAFLLAHLQRQHGSERAAQTQPLGSVPAASTAATEHHPPTQTASADGGADQHPGKQAADRRPAVPQADAHSQQQMSLPSTQSTQSVQSGFGHAVGPKWTSMLPEGKGRANVILQPGCEIASIAADGHELLRRTQGQQTSSSANGTSQAAPCQGQAVAGKSATPACPADVIGRSRDDASSSSASGPAPTEPAWPMHVRLTNASEYDADLLISAIGVTPAVDWLPADIERDLEEGGLLVNRYLQTSIPDVYAAGDACTVRQEDTSPHWFQMRLWTQARIMGTFAAHSMAGLADDLASGFNFELFTHVTRFGGLKVVCLGLYNGQKLQHEPEADIVSYSRATEGDSPTFVRVILVRGRMQGAVLLGDTDLEETFENLILDNIDLSRYGPSLLDSHLELDEMFD